MSDGSTDPYEVLGPDEIQIKSSRRNLTGIDGLETDIILGDVLVISVVSHYNPSLLLMLTYQITRNPCKVPTDVRKVVFCYDLNMILQVDAFRLFIRSRQLNTPFYGTFWTSSSAPFKVSGDCWISSQEVRCFLLSYSLN